MDQATAPDTLIDLVAYQEDGVVSKTVLDKQSGTVTLFAFDKGQGLSQHSAPCDAMVGVLDGLAEITIGGEPVEVGQGEMIIMPADIPHALSALEPFKMMLVMIRS